MSEYTLHGRPLKVGDKVGDKVWSLDDRDWIKVDLECDLRIINYYPKAYVWDEPPAVDLSSIPPPLCWIEGFPVRKGTAMMCCGSAVVIDSGINGYLKSFQVDGCELGGSVKYFTFALPPNTRPMKNVMRTMWFNKYPLHGERSRMWDSEEEAKEYAYTGCQGQQSVTFEVEVPA